MLSEYKVREEFYSSFYNEALERHPDLDKYWIGFQRAYEHFATEPVELEPYDAGCLNDYGGGNVSWWHDYIRAELDRAHDFYQSQLNNKGE